MYFNPIGVLTIVILERGVVGLDFRDNRIGCSWKKDSYAGCCPTCIVGCSKCVDRVPVYRDFYGAICATDGLGSLINGNRIGMP